MSETAEISVEEAAALPVPLARQMALKDIPFSVLGRCAPETMQQALDYATIMAKSDFCVPPKFRNNPGACLAVAQIAWRNNGDPYSYAGKAYTTKDKAGNERLAFEAQLIAALVNTRAPLVARPTVAFEGELTRRVCVVSATFIGSDQPAVLRTPEIGKIGVKNSPLWHSDPDQQLAYYALRSFGRRFCPEVILGMYTPEEVAMMPGEAVTPSAGALPAPSEKPINDLAFLDDAVEEGELVT